MCNMIGILGGTKLESTLNPIQEPGWGTACSGELHSSTQRGQRSEVRGQRSEVSSQLPNPQSLIPESLPSNPLKTDQTPDFAVLLMPVMPERADRFQPIEAGHVDVEDGDVGLQAGQLPQRLISVGRFANDLEARVVPDDIAQPVTEERMIIHDQHCHFLFHIFGMENGTSTVKIVPPPGLESITRAAPRMRTRSAIPLSP